MTIGTQLLLTKLKKLKHEIAAQEKVTLRTLRNWCATARSGKQLKRGRPHLSETMHKQAMWLVAREMKRQGYPGWRPIAIALYKVVPITLIQFYVAELKKRRRKRQQVRLAKHRITIEVLNKNALWVQDGMSGRQATHETLEAQVIKDRASLTTVSVVTGVPATGAKIVEQLESAKALRGLPLVWGTDNGSCYYSAPVEEFLNREKVIHLRSRAYTPQHNGGAEIMVRELKETAELDTTVWAQGSDVVQCKLEKACTHLNNKRLRGSKKYKTSSQLDNTLPIVYNNVRVHFFEVCSLRINHCTEGLTNTHAMRMEERKVIFDTMEEFGFIKRMRGGRPYTMEADVKTEVFF